MAIDWSDVRYRGDRRDVEEMFAVYRVGDYLAAFEENRKLADLGLRERLLKHGIRLNEQVSPRIFRLFGEMCDALEMQSEAEVFCLPDATVNAFAAVERRGEKTWSLVGITAGALERLEDAEIRAILGHEIGHFLFENDRLSALLVHDPVQTAITVLPPLGESLFLRWRKKAEVSADRVGLLASRDARSASTALLKATFGLSERNLNLDVESLVGQLDEIRGHPELIRETFAEHPLLAIRLKALDLFAGSAKAARNGFPARGQDLLDDEALEGAVDELLHLTRRYPSKPLHVAMMQTIARGGALLLGADRDVSDDEVKLLVQILHRYFTDEPESEIVTDQAEIERSLPEAVRVVNEEGSGDDKAFILSRLAEIALADGALVEPESAAILAFAEQLHVPSRIAYGIMVGAAQSVGFRADAKLNNITSELRRSLQLGFSFAGDA